MSEDTPKHSAQADTGFSEHWLSLREPADHLARDTSLNDRLVKWFKQKDSHHVLELGAGTGSNLRYLMPLLGHDQHWLLLDNDAALFDRLPQLLQGWALTNKAHFSYENSQCRIEHDNFSATVNYQVINLANELDQISLDNVQLLTASALLDLTSAVWLNTLASLINKHPCACLFTLNYDGTIRWQPQLDTDNEVSSLLNQHQLTDKGFGKALGPLAGQHLAQALIHPGRQVETADSDWVIQAESHELQLAIIDGWAPAALEQDNHASDTIAQWHSMRRQHVDERSSVLTVGHIDILSLPDPTG